MFRAARGPVLALDTDSLCDIGACVVEGVNVAPGRAIPDDGDPRIHRALEGFMFTCGPDHIRHPEPVPGDAGGARYPLHGSFSGHHAEILPGSENEVVVRVPVRLADGGTARLERRWRIDEHTGEVFLHDVVVNTGVRAFPLFMMYHFNLAGSLLADDSRLEGEMLGGGGFPWASGLEKGSVFCVPAGAGEAEVSLGPLAAGGRVLRLRFDTATLPFLQVWRNRTPPCNVIGIEPVTHRLARRGELGQAGEFDLLSPGEGREFRLSFRFS